MDLYYVILVRDGVACFLRIGAAAPDKTEVWSGPLADAHDVVSLLRMIEAVRSKPRT
jgi:hypothetical protein